MNREFIKACLVEAILNGEEDIEALAEKFSAAFPSVDADVLGEIWVEVMSELPELN